MARSMWDLASPPTCCITSGSARFACRDAYLAGKMHLDSSPLKALSLMTGLLEMFHFVEGLYPGVLQKRGLL